MYATTGTANMVMTLQIEGASLSAAESWNAFVSARANLVARMELATCDGCDDCGIRCLEGIAVTRSEYDAVTTKFAGLPHEMQRRILGEEKTVPWPGAEDSGATMTWCRYRDQERDNCSVYSERPTVCRLFGHTDWLPCPTGAVTKFATGTDGVWNVYREFERRTWAEWDNAIETGSI